MRWLVKLLNSAINHPGFRLGALPMAVLACVVAASPGLAQSATPPPLGVTSEPAIAAPDPSEAPPEAPAPRVPRIVITGEPPAGFEDIDNGVETLFDIILAGRRLGSSPVRLERGMVTFLDPQGVAALLPQNVDRAAVLAFLSQPVEANEALRCLPGRTSGCGILPSGQLGVIANPESFTLELFIPNALFQLGTDAVRYVGPPISGPSLIQTAQMSLSTRAAELSDVRYGGTFNTTASIGRTSLSAQTLLRDQGSNLQTAALRRMWTDRFAAAGLLQDEQSLTFRTFRIVGAEFGSHFAARIDAAQGLSTPIEVILPRASRVEIYRDSVLIRTVQLEAGLQRIDTSTFPGGSYPVRILATDGTQVVLDETRVFTRVSDLPPAGALAFRVRGGLRVRDTRLIDPLQSASDPFLPEVVGEPVASASLGKRIGAATGIEVQALVVDDTVFGELAATTYRGRVSGFAAVSAGSDKSYSVLASGSWQLPWGSLNLSGRHTRLADEFGDPELFRARFRPYFRSEDLISSSFSAPLGTGSLTLTGSYSRSPELDRQYSVGARYNRPLSFGAIGDARLSAFGFKTDRDLRFGISISLFRRLSQNTSGFAGVGAEYRQLSGAVQGAEPEGLFPVAEARVTRSLDLGEADGLASIGASTSADNTAAFVAGSYSSNRGLLDMQLQYEQRRGSTGQGDLNVTANGFSGFTLGGGKLSLGMREIGGDSAVLVDIDRSAIPDDFRDQLDGSSAFSVYVDSREVGRFAAGDSLTVMLPSLREYALQLQPENAPPYLIDLTRQSVPLWPGNVVRLSYAAQLAVTLFGRLVDENGNPLANTVLRVGNEASTTDSAGYFLLSGRLDQDIQPIRQQVQACRPLRIADLVASLEGSEYFRLGSVTCQLPDGSEQDSTE